MVMGIPHVKKPHMIVCTKTTGLGWFGVQLQVGRRIRITTQWFLLIAGCRLLVAACCLLVSGCWLPAALLHLAALLPGVGRGCWIVVVNHKGNRSITKGGDTGDTLDHVGRQKIEEKTNLDEFSAAAKSRRGRN